VGKENVGADVLPKPFGTLFISKGARGMIGLDAKIKSESK
jgi:hypothetical protein